MLRSRPYRPPTLSAIVITALTFPFREIRKSRHEAVFETSVASRRTEGSNLVPSSTDQLRFGRRDALGQCEGVQVQMIGRHHLIDTTACPSLHIRGRELPV